MSKSSGRATVAGAALVLLLVSLAVLPAAPAAGGTAASSTRGSVCTADQEDAVTLVIDYQALGGPTDIYCVSGLKPRATGWDVLMAAGVPAAGTVHDGASFVCRLNNRPSQTEVIDRKGDPGYTEQCVDTPPANAYWSYWWAPPGGSWAYSQLGVMSHRAQLGGFEGWSFSLNATAATNPAPRVAPVAAPGTQPGGAGSDSAAQPGGGGVTPGGAAPAAPATAPPPRTTAPRTTPSPDETVGPPSGSPTPAPAQPSSEPSGTQDAAPPATSPSAPAPDVTAQAAASTEPDPPSHAPTTVLALLAATAAALGAAAIRARRRRRSAGPDLL